MHPRSLNHLDSEGKYWLVSGYEDPNYQATGEGDWHEKQEVDKETLERLFPD